MFSSPDVKARKTDRGKIGCACACNYLHNFAYKKDHTRSNQTPLCWAKPLKIMEILHIYDYVFKSIPMIDATIEMLTFHRPEVAYFLVVYYYGGKVSMLVVKGMHMQVHKMCLHWNPSKECQRWVCNGCTRC